MFILVLLVVAACAAIIIAVLRGGKKRGARPALAGYAPTAVYTYNVHELLRINKLRLGRLALICGKINNETLADRINNIDRMAGDMLLALEKNPEKSADVRIFLDSNLPVLTALVEEYDACGVNGPQWDENMATPENLDASVAEMEASFRIQLEALAGGADGK